MEKDRLSAELSRWRNNRERNGKRQGPSTWDREKTMALAAMLGWTLIILGSGIWNGWSIWQNMLERARSVCAIALEKDLAYRYWAASHGGVYVPITEKTRPNPYLEVPHRDVVTTDGQRLTLLNPAYMTRQAFTLTEKLYGVKGHITSLNYLNPVNAPDDWEERVLRRAEQQGPDDVTDLVVNNGHYSMRLMHPMVMKESCLKCHADMGYQLGDIRGGISFTLPIDDYVATARTSIAKVTMVHGALLFFGLLLIKMLLDMTESRRLRRELERREEQLRTLITPTLTASPSRMARVAGWNPTRPIWSCSI